jgi:hypothetical protein
MKGMNNKTPENLKNEVMLNNRLPFMVTVVGSCLFLHDGTFYYTATTNYDNQNYIIPSLHSFKAVASQVPFYNCRTGMIEITILPIVILIASKICQQRLE